jgi:hypothetical protein
MVAPVASKVRPPVAPSQLVLVLLAELVAARLPNITPAQAGVLEVILLLVVRAVAVVLLSTAPLPLAEVAVVVQMAAAALIPVAQVAAESVSTVPEPMVPAVLLMMSRATEQVVVVVQGVPMEGTTLRQAVILPVVAAALVVAVAA